MKNSFNCDLDHIRKLWGIPQGKTLIYNNGELFAIGNQGWLCKPANDNEAKS